MRLAELTAANLTVTESFAGVSFTKVLGTSTPPGSWQLLQDDTDVFAYIRAGWAADSNGSTAADLASIMDSFTDINTTVSMNGVQVAAATASLVPEPASLALVGVILAGLGLARRRKA